MVFEILECLQGMKKLLKILVESTVVILMDKHQEPIPSAGHFRHVTLVKLSCAELSICKTE